MYRSRWTLIASLMLASAGAHAQSGRAFDAGPYTGTLWTLADGLPQNSVYGLAQARDGALWLVTDSGPARFDGVAFETFVDLDAHPDLTTAVHEDARGRVWIGSYASGTVRYEPPSALHPGGRFLPVAPDDEAAHAYVVSFAASGTTVWVATSSGVTRIAEGDRRGFAEADGLPPGTVRTVLAARDGAVWVGTDGGLARLRGDRFEAVGGEARVSALAEAPDGTVWVGTGDGLGRVRGARVEPVDALDGATVTALVVARDGAVWAGTEAPTVHRLDVATGAVGTLPTGEPGRSGGVRALLEDREGNVWAGTYGYGLVRYRRNAVRMLTQADGLTDNLVRPIQEARDGSVWIGTRGAAVHRLRDGGLRAFRLPGITSGGSVEAMAERADGSLWAGVSGHGVARVDGDRLRIEIPGAVDPTALLEDRRGRLWIGMRGGLWRQDADGVIRFSAADGVPDGDVRTIVQDARGSVWIGTSSGLLRADDRGGATTFTAFGTADGLADPGVFAILEDPDVPGALWIGGGAHLTHVAPDGRLTALDLPRMLVADGRGALWTRDLHSLRRVALADLRAAVADRTHDVPITSYGREAGLEGEGVYGFGPPAASTRDGRLFFPTTLGAAVVTLDALGEALPPPPVAVRFVEADEVRHRVVPKRLGPDLDRLVIGYAGIDLTAPERVRYRYRLDGFDAGWVDAGTERQAVYTNLPPGDYSFRVEAQNHQGTWSASPATLAVRVAPRVTETAWFRWLAALGLLGLAAAGWRARERGRRQQETLLRETVRRRTEALQLEKERAEAARDDARQARATVEVQTEQLRALDAAKSRLFANLSHEFRTPLALILAPLEAAMADAPDLRLAHAQAARLLDLVNQLLDLSTLDAGHLRLRRRPTDLGALVARTVGAFRSDADARGVALSTHLPDAPLVADVDPAHVERVVTNLVANALAHTDRGGKVGVALHRDGPEARLAVRDTGEGIPADALPHLFDRFFQVERAGQAGTGIGLALAKELVALHGGRIGVESQEGFGSTFSVALPLGEPAGLSPPAVRGVDDEPPSGPSVRPEPSPTAGPIPETSADAQPVPEAFHDAAPGTPNAERDTRPTLLLVEDHDDLRDFLARSLADAWHVHPEADGAEGLRRARALRPDVVLSDVMMPALDGFALTAALRAEAGLARTPVLLLTARADAEGEIAGLAAGADDYLAKPFSLPVLRARLDALLTRHRARQGEAHRVVVGVRDVEVTSDEAAFVERVRDHAEAALGDAGLTVETLAGRVAVSPRQLTRRLKALTGLSPGAFVRSMRMQRAAQLLAGRSGTVSEVAYTVGFRSVSHFTKRFKAEFGVPPSAYADHAPGPDDAEATAAE